MRLDQLYIRRFKNLVDLTMDFDEKVLTIALIGRNATAKSNLIEALVWIFRNLDLGEAPHFRYRLNYVCRNRHIEIDADSDSTKSPRIVVDGETIPYTSFLRSRRIYLPSNVFGYYSGTSRRLEHLFDYHQERFYHALREAGPNEKAPPRPLFYAQTAHSQYVLLAFFSFADKEALRFLKKQLGITGFRNATFILRQPRWYNATVARDDIFWGARGVVRGFLDELYSTAIAPIFTTQRVPLPLGRIRKEKWIHLRIENLNSLHKLASKYGNNVEFFKVLESTYYGGLIQELKIKVRKKGVEEDLEFPELSEGEQQLLTVLGLLRFTKEEESLFLLDEPDTHLNPASKLGYLELMQGVVGPNATSHVLIVTHDPLLIGGLRKEQVMIFFQDRNNRIVVSPPIEDPIGMGIEGLLTSDLFGLRTTLDASTERKLQKKQNLTAKLIKGKLTTKEKLQLQLLNEELGKLGFLRAYTDPLYRRFVEATQQSKYELLRKEVLTPDERAKQAEITLEIVRKLKKTHDVHR